MWCKMHCSFLTYSIKYRLIQDLLSLCFFKHHVQGGHIANPVICELCWSSTFRHFPPTLRCFWQERTCGRELAVVGWKCICGWRGLKEASHRGAANWRSWHWLPATVCHLWMGWLGNSAGWNFACFRSEMFILGSEDTRIPNPLPDLMLRLRWA